MRTNPHACIALLATLSACTAVSPPHEAPSAPPVAEPPAPPAAGPSSSASPPESGAPSPDAPAQGASDDALLGAWKSASCGARKYPREITFAKDGTFAAEDLVSPCPPKVACVWSGIIHHRGQYKRSGDVITLLIAEASKGPGGQPFPASLSVDAASGAPAEASGDGKTCSYGR